MMSHHLKPDPFAGLALQDSAAWYRKFQAWLSLNEWTEKPVKVANGLRLLLVLPASTAAVQSARLAQESITMANSPAATSSVTSVSAVATTPSWKDEIDDLRKEIRSFKATTPVVAATAGTVTTSTTICQLCNTAGHVATACHLFTDSSGTHSRKC